MDKVKYKKGTVYNVNISDDVCMKEDYWIDYSTAEKNEQFVNDVNTASESGTLLDFIKETLPTWIINVCDEYDTDLSHMSKNWSTLCDRFNVPTQKILLVSYIAFGEDASKTKHKNLTHLCNVLTKNGYVVKDKQTFKICEKCNKLMLSDQAQKTLWNTDDKGIWKFCRSCS